MGNWRSGFPRAVAAFLLPLAVYAAEDGVTASTWYVELGGEPLEGTFDIVSQDWSGTSEAG